MSDYLDITKFTANEPSLFSAHEKAREARYYLLARVTTFIGALVRNQDLDATHIRIEMSDTGEFATAVLSNGTEGGTGQQEKIDQVTDQIDDIISDALMFGFDDSAMIDLGWAPVLGSPVPAFELPIGFGTE